MPDFVIVAPSEIVAGLRLAGVEVLQVRTPTEVLDHARDIVARADCGIAVVPEHLLSGLERDEYREIMQSDHPYFVSLPMDWRPSQDVRAGLESRLGRILGCRINLSDRLLGHGKEP